MTTQAETKVRPRPRYIVVGRAKDGTSFYHETDLGQSNMDAVLHGLISGEYVRPCRVLAVDEAAGTVRNVSQDFANLVAKRIVNDGYLLMDRDTEEFLHDWGVYLQVRAA